MRVLALTALLTVAATANATKIYMGVFETSGPFASYVTIIERPCDSLEGNAMLMNGERAVIGCWKEQGEKVVVNAIDGKFLASYDKTGLKLVADKDIAQPSLAQGKNSKKTLLNCVADAWVGDVEVERDQEGQLRNVVVAGASVESSESGSSIRFNFNGLKVVLSSVTGAFTYESNSFAHILSGTVRRGAGQCHVINSAKKF